MTRLEATLELVAVASVSRSESALAELIETRLRAAAHLEVERVGDNVIARTRGSHAHRYLVAGHLDTVPGDASLAHIEGDVLHGVGACDMKGSLAVMLELALDPAPRPREVTWVFYAREEIARAESGLVEVLELRPDLLVADVAVLGEPSGGRVEAGCQGSLRVEIELAGARAHTSRPFTGVNAIHRLGALLDVIAAYKPRVVSLEGVEYTEQLQAVFVEGGVAGNVVPDRVRLVVNHRFAPDRDADAAYQWLLDYVRGALTDGDVVGLVDAAPAAPPALGNAELARLVELTGTAPGGKVGWTDVATFHEMGVPSVNFGAGDPLLAHRADEFVRGEELDHFHAVLGRWLAE